MTCESGKEKEVLPRRFGAGKWPPGRTKPPQPSRQAPARCVNRDEFHPQQEESGQSQRGFQAGVQLCQHLGGQSADPLLQPVFTHECQQIAGNQAVTRQACRLSFGRRTVHEEAGRISLPFQIVRHLGHDCMPQTMVIRISLDHNYGAFLPALARGVGKTCLQYVASLDVHASSGSSSPSPETNSKASPASASISLVVQGL